MSHKIVGAAKDDLPETHYSASYKRLNQNLRSLCARRSSPLKKQAQMQIFEAGFRPLYPKQTAVKRGSILHNDLGAPICLVLIYEQTEMNWQSSELNV